MRLPFMRRACWRYPWGMVEIIFSRQQGGEKAVRTVDVPAGPRRHPGDNNLSWNFSILGGG
jgi:hypothetical protein